MAWTNSKIYVPFIEDALEDANDVNLVGGTPQAALFNNSPTPDQTVASAAAAYGAGVWASGEVSEAGQWAAGGVALGGVTFAPSSNVLTFDANDTASGAAADLADVYGVLVYDAAAASPVADQGICFNYLGGANSVVNGTFTVVWNASGIFTLTL